MDSRLRSGYDEQAARADTLTLGAVSSGSCHVSQFQSVGLNEVGPLSLLHGQLGRAAAEAWGLGKAMSETAVCRSACLP